VRQVRAAVPVLTTVEASDLQVTGILMGLMSSCTSVLSAPLTEASEAVALVTDESMRVRVKLCCEREGIFADAHLLPSKPVF